MFRLTRSIQSISHHSIKSSKVISFNSRRFIGDGTLNQKTWSLSSLVLGNFTKEGKKMFGWLISLLTILFIWPFGIVQLFDKIDNVPPHLDTSQVQLKRIGLNKFQTIVEIPNVYVKLDKNDEDEGDDVPDDDVPDDE